MKKPDVSKFIKSTKATLSKHSPEILTGIGIAGMITTTILAVKATPRAIDLIREAEYEAKEELSKAEKFKMCWKFYLPSAVTCVASVTCLVGASSVNARRNAALATAYSLSETALREYKEKVVETFGEKKEQIVKDKIAKEKIENDPVSKNEVIITERGNTLCYDSISGRYFISDIEKIKKAVNELNRRILLDMYVSLNELYDELNLDHTRVGDDLGWNIDEGLIKVDFSSHIADDGRPCVVINYEVAPKYDYYKLS